MNKSELIERISKSTELTKVSVEDTLSAAIEIIKKSVKKGEDVTLLGFGTFTKTRRRGRLGRNPQTGAQIKIPPRVVPRFRPGKEFKEMLGE